LNNIELLKRTFLLFVLILSSVIVKAQGDYNFMPYAIGTGVSIIRGYTNVAKQNNTLAANINFTDYVSPYLPITFELQKGRLWGGSVVTDPSGREYVNNYLALKVHVDLQLGQILDYEYGDFNDAIKNIYIGGAIGLVSDNVKNQRFDFLNPSYGNFPGKDQSINPLISLRAGYEVKFYNEYDEPYIRLDFEYEHNVVFGEGLDGYDDPPSKFKNNNSDQYRQISVTLKYDFGLIRSYTKRIRGSFD
jgi:hypothetical protein